MHLLTASLGLLCMCVAVVHAQDASSSAGHVNSTEAVLLSVVDVLRSSQSYRTAALVLPFLRPVIQLPVTLLIPTDEAIATILSNVTSTAGFGQQFQSTPSASAANVSGLNVTLSPQLLSLAQFHMVRSGLAFSQLLDLPPGTLLPTLLPGTRVEVVNNSLENYTLNNANVINPDLCNSTAASVVTCQGINQVLQQRPATMPGFQEPADSGSPSVASPEAESPPAPAPAPASAEGLEPLGAPRIDARDVAVAGGFGLQEVSVMRSCMGIVLVCLCLAAIS